MRDEFDFAINEFSSIRVLLLRETNKGSTYQFNFFGIRRETQRSARHYLQMVSLLNF